MQNQELEILCPDHKQKIVCFSQNSEPKCQMCLAKAEIPLEQFVKNIEQHRKDKINSLKISQQTCQKNLTQLRKDLVMNKDLFVKNMDILIKTLDERIQSLMNDFNGEINTLSKEVSKLQINELKSYSIEMNSKVQIDQREKEKNQILLLVIKEYEQLQSQTNIIQKLQDLIQQKVQADSTIDPFTCIAGNAYDMSGINYQIEEMKRLKGGKIVPLIILCPPACKCQSYKSINWNHQTCGKPLFIDQNGVIFCGKSLLNSECKSFFIRNAMFKCKSECQMQKFETATQFIMSFMRRAQILCIDSGFSVTQTVDFCSSLNQSIIEKWIV